MSLLYFLCAMLVLWHYQNSIHQLFLLMFVFFVLVSAVIDFRHQILPDVLVYSLLWLGLLANTMGLFVPLPEAVLSVCFSFIFINIFAICMTRIKGKTALGGGDVKYIAALAAWVGQSILVVVFISAILLLIQTLLFKQLVKNSKDAETGLVAFGPALSLAAFLVIGIGIQTSYRWLFELLTF